MFDNHSNFICIVIGYSLQMTYIFLFVPESLSIHNRKHTTNIKCNPFQPLLHIKDNPIVFWCCVLQFVITMPETGVLDTV